MGGLGSGKWKRINSKAVADDLIQIDVRALNKSNCLAPGQTGMLTWAVGKTRLGRVSFDVTDDSIRLNYMVSSNNDSIQVRQVIQFDFTPVNYGGFRKWFKCPDCGKRIAVIYLAGSGFCCRHCNDLVFKSQNENEMDRSKRKARKIRDRLGVSNDLFSPVLIKPKGMHYKTFEQLKQAEFEASKVAFTLMVQGLS